MFREFVVFYSKDKFKCGLFETILRKFRFEMNCIFSASQIVQVKICLQICPIFITNFYW